MEIDDMYRCIITLSIDDILIDKSRIHSKDNNFVKRIEITSYPFSLFIGRLYSDTNEFYRW